MNSYRYRQYLLGLALLTPAVLVSRASAEEYRTSLRASGMERLAKALVCRLHYNRMNYLLRIRGQVLSDEGSNFVRVSLGTTSGIQPGDLLEVTYSSQSLRNDGSMHAATLVVLSSNESESLTRVIDRDVPNLADVRFRVQYFRNQRIPVRVVSDCEGGNALVRALEKAINDSPHFSLVPFHDSRQAGRGLSGSVLVDHDEHVYISLNRYDGIRINEHVEATRTEFRQDPDDCVRPHQVRVGLFRVMRVDATGALCAVLERDKRIDVTDEKKRIWVRETSSETSNWDNTSSLASLRGEKSAVRLVSYVPSNENPLLLNHDGVTGPKSEGNRDADHIYLLQVTMDRYGGGTRWVQATVSRADGHGSTIWTAESEVESSTLAPVVRSRVTKRASDRKQVQCKRLSHKIPYPTDFMRSGW